MKKKNSGMEQGSIEIRHKTWYRMLMYGCGLFTISAGGYYLFGFIFSDMSETLPLPLYTWLILSFSIVFLTGFIVIPHFYRNRILITREGIRETGIYTKEVPYRNIRKVKVLKNGIKIYSDSIFNRIVISSLHEDYHSAVELISSNLSDYNEIKIDGKSDLVKSFKDNYPDLRTT